MTALLIAWQIALDNGWWDLAWLLWLELRSAGQQTAVAA